MTKNNKSTFDRMMEDKDFKKEFDKEYQDLLISELVLALMNDEKISVRKLAKEAGISPSVVQDIRSGKQKDIKLSNFKNIVNACGYNIVLENGHNHIVL